jgi:hypothetical protein
MTPEVLAQHQMVEIIRLRDHYQDWANRNGSMLDRMDYDKNPGAYVASSQTDAMLRHVVKDLTKIIEQL